jgi:hypothetical protein
LDSDRDRDFHRDFNLDFDAYGGDEFGEDGLADESEGGGCGSV